jgi:hypothetical protein
MRNPCVQPRQVGSLSDTILRGHPFIIVIRGDRRKEKAEGGRMKAEGRVRPRFARRF